jgi:hypothetical protein
MGAGVVMLHALGGRQLVGVLVLLNSSCHTARMIQMMRFNEAIGPTSARAALFLFLVTVACTLLAFACVNNAKAACVQRMRIVPVAGIQVVTICAFAQRRAHGSLAPAGLLCAPTCACGLCAGRFAITGAKRLRAGPEGACFRDACSTGNSDECRAHIVQHCRKATRLGGQGVRAITSDSGNGVHSLAGMPDIIPHFVRVKTTIPYC